MSREVRSASFDQIDARTAYLLWQLREAVFVVEQQCPYLDLDGRDLEPTTRHLWVEEEGAVAACLRVLEDPSVARIGRVAVAKRARGKGLARDLMERALAEVGRRASVLDAQSYLVDWYTSLGYEPSGPEFLDDGIPHVPMRRRPSWNHPDGPPE